MKAIICRDLDDARRVRDVLDRMFGYPKPGYNPSSGLSSMPGDPSGWTATIAEILDVGGVVYVVGVSEDVARAIMRASVDVEPAGFGTSYMLEISGWNGQSPILTERVSSAKPSASDLESAKLDALRIIESRKMAAMNAGFEHPNGSGTRFSLAVEAQILRTRLMLVYKTPAMTWPLMWPTLDPARFIALTGPADVEAIYIAESLALRSINDRFAALAAQVASADSVDSVAAILGGAA